MFSALEKSGCKKNGGVPYSIRCAEYWLENNDGTGGEESNRCTPVARNEIKNRNTVLHRTQGETKQRTVFWYNYPSMQYPSNIIRSEWVFASIPCEPSKSLDSSPLPLDFSFVRLRAWYPLETSRIDIWRGGSSINNCVALLKLSKCGPRSLCLDAGENLVCSGYRKKLAWLTNGVSLVNYTLVKIIDTDNATCNAARNTPALSNCSSICAINIPLSVCHQRFIVRWIMRTLCTPRNPYLTHGEPWS